jgi:Xaa-Pro aminopeptidase
MNLETQVKARIESVQVEMNRIRAGLLVLGLSSGMRYLTGFTDEPGERMLLLLVPREGDALFFVPQLYEPQVRDASPVERFTVWRDGEDPALVLRHALTKVGDLRGTILVEPTLWAECLLILQQALPDNSFASAAGILAPLRMRKSAEEVELLRRAGELADAAFVQVTQEPIVGLTELQLAAKLEANMLSAGADSVAFNTLVASAL